MRGDKVKPSKRQKHFSLPAPLAVSLRQSRRVAVDGAPASSSQPPRREKVTSPLSGRFVALGYCGGARKHLESHEQYCSFSLQLRFISRETSEDFQKFWILLMLTSDWEPMRKHQCVKGTEALDVDSIYSVLNALFMPSSVLLVIQKKPKRLLATHPSLRRRQQRPL